MLENMSLGMRIGVVILETNLEIFGKILNGYNLRLCKPVPGIDFNIVLPDGVRAGMFTMA